MKRFVYAGGAVGLTGALVLLAMAVAQRDARVGDVSADEAKLPYANQEALPMSIPTSSATSNPLNDTWPPAPIVRANNELDGNRPTTHASLTSYESSSLPTSQEAALAEPPPFRSLPSSTPNIAGLLPPPGNPAVESSTGNNIGTSSSNNTNALSDAPGGPSSTGAFQAGPGNSPFATSRPSELNSGYAAPNNNPGFQESGRESPQSSLATPPEQNLIPPNLMPRSPGTSFPDTPAAPLDQPPRFPATTELNPTPKFGAISAREPSQSPTQPSFPSGNANSVPPSLPVGLTAGSVGSAPENIRSPLANAPSSNSNWGDSTALNGTANAFSSAAPGVRHLDGSQNPSMEIQKRAPAEVQVGMLATFTLLVRNVGNATAFDVNVFDSVPKGAKLVRTNPQAQQNGPNGLVWKLGEMAARTEKVLTIELIPETEGEIGSVASVNFAAQASVRTMSTQPKLVVKQLLDSVVLGGESIRITIDVANVGTGTARDVRLEEDVPANLRHASGAQVLGLTVGDLAPGESEKFDIELKAISAGKFSNVVRAVSENAATNESASPMEVVAPKLNINVEGPRLRYLERQATYTVSVTNTGTAIATNVDLMLYLPSGMQFNSTENRGEFISSQNAVMWQLAELAAGQTASAKVTLLPVVEGDYVLRMQSQADSVRAEPIEKPVRVEGQSELAFSIEDDNDPIETDGKTTYLIKITNVGTRVDNNVELSVDLPEGAVLEQVDAPVSYRESQRTIFFAPIAQMQSKDQQLIRLSIRHTREGIHVVKARVKSKLREVPVEKGESTQVYRDQ